MSRVLPILFNSEMVRAVLDGRKTATRRTVKQAVWEDFVCEGEKVLHYFDQKRNIYESPIYKTPYQPGDILYVRETFAFIPCIDCHIGGPFVVDNSNCSKIPVIYENRDSISEGCFFYRADYPEPKRITWRPSIHMPKEAARIWLKVTDVRVERLHDMTLDDFLSEGVVIRPEAFNDPENAYMQARSEFARIWDSTIRKSQTDLNPWVWVIEFERCEKPEGEG